MIRVVNQWLVFIALLLIIVFIAVSTATVGKIYYKLQALDAPLQKACESVDIVHKKLIEVESGNKNILQAFRDFITRKKPVEAK